MFQVFLKQFNYLLCSICCIVSFSTFAFQDKNQSQKQLDDIKHAISSEKQKITQTAKQRQALEQQLKKDDIAIAKIAKKLNSTQTELTATQQQITALETKKQQLSKQKIQQENLLAKQLQTAYTSGNHDYLKLLLNQQDPSKIQRSISYYQYLNKARIAEIENFKTTIAELLTVVSQQQEKSTQLSQLQAKQTAQQNNLKQSKAQRSDTIKKLNKDLLSSQDLLVKLVAEEENLLIEIQRLAKLAKKSQKLTGLSKLQGKLKWPVSGKLKHRFGTRKQGYLKWKGVLLSAPIGRQVKSIHNGKVLFSNWLKGYGLVTVIDHGNGYMSLYGHNQALLKSVGDSVDAGEPIALIGQSGGQNQPGLYFEIRHQGQAVNPRKWCR
ncbi:MAG: murein hydrolase activator EnvC family protein [Thalassotalea sp.]